MAEEYEELDVVVDSEELADDQFAYLEGAFPGWVPAAGNLDTWILEAGARMGSELGTIMLNVPPEIWKVYGEKIVRLLPTFPAPAIATSNWTLGDDDGHTIEAGTTVDIEGRAFEVVAEAVVPTGQTVANGVQLVAVEEGQDGSGLTGPPTLADTTGYEAVIVLTGPTSGGQDEEDPDEYIGRLAREAELFAPRPLLPRDVEIFARRVPGVARVLVLDNYRPASAPGGEANDVALTFTVVPIDDAGQPAAVGAVATLQADLEANRGTDWNIWIIAPQYTTIDVNFEATAHRDFIPSDVEARALAAVAEYLSPANWGEPQFGEDRRWVNTPDVRHRELATVLNNVEGIDNVTLLEFNVDGVGLVENQNVSLGAGPARLPLPGDITGTVVAP